jgi:hypothetical protein
MNENCFPLLKASNGKSLRDLPFDKLGECSERFNVIANNFDNSQRWNGHWFKLEKAWNESALSCTSSLFSTALTCHIDEIRFTRRSTWGEVSIQDLHQ